MYPYGGGRYTVHLVRSITSIPPAIARRMLCMTRRRPVSQSWWLITPRTEETEELREVPCPFKLGAAARRFPPLPLRSDGGRGRGRERERGIGEETVWAGWARCQL